MSHVSNCIIVSDTNQSPMEKTILAKEWVGGENGRIVQKFECIDMIGAGGSKYFESNVFAAAFNYVSNQEIIEWFEKLPWGKFDSASLTVDGNDYSHVSVVINGKIALSTDSS